MGWKSTIRSLNAAANRAERASRRRHRELERQRKAFAKMQELEQAAYEVEEFENHIEVIQSMHTDCSEAIDWHHVASLECPPRPKPQHDREQEATSRRTNYSPSWFDKLFKQVDKKIHRLEAAIPQAKDQDEKASYEALSAWEGAVRDWEDDSTHARNVLSGDAKARLDVLKEADPFSELDTLGSQITFNVLLCGTLEVNINIHGSSIVPKQQKSLLKSGRLTTKDMPIGRFNEIYQDYVCSAVLRIAREIFALLPDEYVLINAKDDLLNSATGHLVPQTILSAFITRKSLSSLNMHNIDPSDSMCNFLHAMKFKKTSGFSAVQPITPPTKSQNQNTHAPTT